MAEIQTIIGSLPVCRGEYDAEVSYFRDNQVTMYGSTFQSIADDNVGYPPAEERDDGKVYAINTDKWIIVANALAAYNAGKRIDDLAENTEIKDEEGTVVKTPFRYIQNDEFIYAIIDSEYRLLFGIYRDSGKPYFPINEMYHIGQNEEFLWVILDKADHPLLGVLKDGSSWAAKAQWLDDVKSIKEKLGTLQTKEDGKALINSDVANSISYISNEEFALAVVDAKMRIIIGIYKNGELFVPNNEMNNVTTSDEWLYALIDARNKLLSAIDKEGIEHKFQKTKFENDVIFEKDLYIGGKKAVISKFQGSTIFVAASDSSERDKRYADYVCDGKNDEVEINKAIEDIGNCGTVFLFAGNFHIDSFGEYEGFEKSAIVVKNTGTYRSVLLKGVRHYYNGTNIVVSQKAFDAISQDEQPCVFNCLSPINNGEEPWYGAFWYVSLQDMFISIPTWKRKCIVVNLRNAGCGEEKNLRISAFGNNQYGEYFPKDYRNEDTPEGLVGITGMHGWTYGDTARYDNISVWGMHEAFQLGGEHLICNSLRARYNYCAYTFGNYKNSLSYGAFDHPLTLINCCDEKSTQGPVFVWNGLAERKIWNAKPDRKMQGITFIDFNIESYKYGAYEVEPGSFCGRIDYHYSDGVYGAFSNSRFWANGSGKKFITHDETHQDGGSTELRNSYTPNYMQRYFDTDLGKELICVNPASKKWVDTNGTVVSQSESVKQAGSLKDNAELLLNKQIKFKSVYDGSEYNVTSENGNWNINLYPDSYEVKVEGYEILPNVLEVMAAKTNVALIAEKTYMVSGAISIEKFNNFKLLFIDSEGKEYQTTILNKNFSINLKNGEYSIELQCTELNIKNCTVNNGNVELGNIL